MSLRTRLSPSLRRLLLAQLSLFIALPYAAAQAKAPDSATAPAADADKKIPVTENAAESKPETKADVVELSPFEVTANTKGYYNANTMSGTRFNTKLDDLASSITVMTKEQMADFGMLDINDIFNYVAGTEGTGTYTDYTLDRNGSISDNVQLNPTQANRVRGIAPANVSLGNIETMGRVPIDPINIDGVEISRGPNANVFGLGNPSGTVNQVPASANLTHDRAAVQFRADNWDGYRQTLDVNQVLIKGVLAIRASQVFQKDGFIRKPSGVDTERYNGMIKYQPFKFTTITGSINYYHAYGNRPNAIPPRDNVSYWVNQGMPTWDPFTQTVHKADGSVLGVFTAAAYNGPNVFNATYLGNNHNQMFIDQTGLAYWAAPQSTTNAVGPTANFTADRYLQTSAADGATFSGTAPRPFNQPLFNTTPTVSDRNLYDWGSINLSAPNRFWDRTTTSNIQIDQIIVNSQMQTLAVQGAFMREDSGRWGRNLIGIANDNGQSGQLLIDINERRLDGTPNPFFLRPYIGVDKPRITSAPAKWDTSRLQAAYRLDLTEEKNALKWLGWFQLTGYAEYKYRVNRLYSWREAMDPSKSPVAWIPAGTYVGNQSGVTGTPALIAVTQGLYRYYVGDKSGHNVDYAPGDFSYGTYPFIWGNGATGVFHTDQIVLDQVATTDSTGGANNTKVVLRTRGGVGQSHLFGDRLVTTVGIRQDDTFTKFGTSPVLLNSDGTTFNYGITDGWAQNYFVNGGRTTNVQFVLRPFQNLAAITKAQDAGGVRGAFAEVANGFSAIYNKSNSFLPLTPAQDLYLHVLPNPTGSDKSFGFGLNMFQGKLVLRFTHYNDLQKDARNGDANTIAQRVIRTDLPLVGATQANPPITLAVAALNWATQVGNGGLGLTGAAIAQKVTDIVQLPADVQAALINPIPPIAATNDIHSIGNEIEVNYNPTPNWTVSASFTDNKSINENVSKTLADWIAQRMPVWTSIIDPRTTITYPSAFPIVTSNGETLGNSHWWTNHYGSATAQTPAANFQAFVAAPYAIIRAQEGKINPQVGRYAFKAATNVRLAAFGDKSWLKNTSVGGALRWIDHAAIGYYGIQDSNGIYQSYDPNRPIYGNYQTYVDLFVTYRTKLFHDKIATTFQLNIRNAGEKTRLEPVGAFPDGTIHTYRIADPQQIFFTTTFEL